jgi:hypothetical protein
MSGGKHDRADGQGATFGAQPRSGERSAVGLKSGKRVANSRPVLRRPTTPATAGRKPAARPPDLRGCVAAPLTQPQSWPGFGAGSPDEIARERESASGLPPEPSVGREASALDALDSESISRLRAFLELLDRWDREANHDSKVM